MHRVPSTVHGAVGALDGLLGRGPLEPFASYHVYEMERLP